MPVFFYIDPEFVNDPKMELVDEITLSYTFFESKDGFHLPLPGYAKPHQDVMYILMVSFVLIELKI